MIEKAVTVIKGAQEEGARISFRALGDGVQLITSTRQLDGTWWESPTPIVLTPEQHLHLMERYNA